LETESNKILHEIKRDSISTLDSLKKTLEGLLVEIKTAQRRDFDSSDFVIDEFRRLVNAIAALTARLEKLP
jgi:hypothetical protein